MKKILLILIGLNSFMVADLRVRSYTIYDRDTKLVWLNSYAAFGNNRGNIAKGTWEEAVSYCENFFGNAGGGWRLPNKKELLSIVDRTVREPSISSKFTQTLNKYYWTSSTSSQDKSKGWAVGFYFGFASTLAKSEVHAVRCVNTYYVF